MSLKRYAVGAFGLLWMLAGCSSDSGGPDAPESAQVVASNKSRLSLAELGDAKVAELARGNAEFAASLYGELAKDGKNVFFSPHSISSALAMTFAGARNNTAAQMKDVLHFSLDESELHPAFNALDHELAARGQGAKGKDAQPFRLRVVNQVWGQKDFAFETPYLDTLAQHYGAGLYLLDFVTQAEASRQSINQWVSDQTEQRIEDLIPAGLINSDTRLVLTNAVYFSASWAIPFAASQTTQAPFTVPSGDTIQVPTMHQIQRLRYAEADAWQAVELPYDGRELSMVILLPREGQLESVQNDLAANLQEAVDALGDRLVTLAMPKFEFRLSAALKAPLLALGMTDAFSNADFTGISTAARLAIEDVVHEAFVSVDENGTEAAAATAVIIGEISMPQPAEINLNRPFVFAIRDNATGAILFLGRVTDPNQS